MDKIAVSVIMPAYNGEQFIEEAISSVLAQTLPDWELVVVDDGSIDATARMVHGFGDQRIRYVYQRNRGQAAALNRGLELARGEFITTLDVDDFFTPDALREKTVYLVNHPETSVVYSDGFYCDESGIAFMAFSEHLPAGAIGNVYDLLIVSPFYGTGATVLVRRNLLDRLQLYYDESLVWCQDWDFYIRLAEKVDFGFVSSTGVNYRVHRAGMTFSMPESHRLDSLIRLRHKVMAAERFAEVSLSQRGAFFYDFLVTNLHGQLAEQEELFRSGPFGALPASEQSRLIRLAADSYLREQKHPGTVRRWLKLAWTKAPFDFKTGAVTALATLNSGLASAVVERWQSHHFRPHENSPFAME
jgi:glycosyltransferase involved in cell wall biosynthesis